MYEGEPLPLDDQEAVKNFKKLCSPLFKGDDNMALCCNPEQLTILKKDLMSAEALLGSCPSCYFNFRMMWCHMACSPNQSDFVIATKVELRERNNFTLALSQYELRQSTHVEDEDYVEPDDVAEEDHKQVTASSTRESEHVKENSEINADTHEYEQDEEKPEEDVLERKKRSDSTLVNPVNAITEIEYYINQDFMDKMVDSCR